MVETFGDPGAITCLATRSATLWVGTRGGGIFRIAAEGEPERFDTTRGLPGNAVTGCVASPRTGDRLWVATEHGVAFHDPQQDRFVAVIHGRFLALAGAGARLLGARGDGTLWEVTTGEAQLVERLDLTPAVLAGAHDGSWAAGDLAGTVIRRGPAPARWQLPSPVRALTFGATLAGGAPPLHALTAEGGWHLTGTTPRPAPELAGVRAFDPDRAPLVAPELEHLELTATATWQGQRLAATDAGLLRQTARGWEAIELGGMPCGSRISALAWFMGALWVGSFERGLCRWDGTSWQRFAGPAYLPSDLINDLATDGQRLYVATLQGAAILDQGGNFQQFRHEQCLGRLRGNCPWFPSVTGVAPDATQPATWLVDNGSLHRIRGQRWQHVASRQLGSTRVTRVAAARGWVAIGTMDRGVLLRGPASSNASFLTLDDQQGLAENWVMDLTFGQDGSLWVATCTHGVSRRFPDGRWDHWTAARGLTDDYTLAVAELDGRLWIGTLRGLTVLDGEQVYRLGVAEGLGGNEVHDILQVGDRIYLATDGGITVLTRTAPPLSPGSSISAQ